MLFSNLESQVLMVLKRFNELFGLQSSIEAEQSHFVQRINQSVFPEIEESRYYKFYESVYRAICYRLGINAEDRIRKANSYNYTASSLAIPPLRDLTDDEFQPTLRVLIILYDTLETENRQRLSAHIDRALSNATLDIGIKWKDGMFYPSGAEVLDHALIEDPFDWLNEYPSEKSDFSKAIENFAEKEYGQVVINCYLVVEGLCRQILGNQKTLENNREELLRRIGLTQEWKSFLSNFINYANEFKRHASDKRNEIKPLEVEGFLYFTGLLIRLMIQAR